MEGINQIIKRNESARIARTIDRQLGAHLFSRAKQTELNYIRSLATEQDSLQIEVVQVSCGNCSEPMLQKSQYVYVCLNCNSKEDISEFKKMR